MFFHTTQLQLCTVIENIDIELNNCEIANIMLLFMYVIFS